MNFEGQVSIEVSRGNGGAAVQVGFTQPARIDRLLRGKTPAQAMEIVPSVFSLCAMAQTQAAQCALDAAAEADTESSAMLTARQCLTEMESLRENALRIAIDWPRFLDEAVDMRTLKPLMRLVPDIAAAMPPTAGRHIDRERALDVIREAETILQELVFAEPVAAWHERGSADAVKRWATAARTPAARLIARVTHAGWEKAGSSVVIPLKQLEASAIRDWLRQNDAVRWGVLLEPTSDTPETTLLARHLDNDRLTSPGARMYPERGLWDRLVARLIELSLLPGRMRDLVDGNARPTSGRMLAAGIGLAEVAAARGMLAHIATIEHGRITDYRILPPTRWNFDATGIAARALRHVADAHAEDAQLLSELVVNAIDPCVGHTVRIN